MIYLNGNTYEHNFKAKLLNFKYYYSKYTQQNPRQIFIFYIIKLYILNEYTFFFSYTHTNSNKQAPQMFLTYTVKKRKNVSLNRA